MTAFERGFLKEFRRLNDNLEGLQKALVLIEARVI